MNSYKRKAGEKDELEENIENTQSDVPNILPKKIRKVENPIKVSVIKLTWNDLKLDETKQSTLDLKTGLIFNLISINCLIILGRRSKINS